MPPARTVYSSAATTGGRFSCAVGRRLDQHAPVGHLGAVADAVAELHRPGQRGGGGDLQHAAAEDRDGDRRGIGEVGDAQHDQHLAVGVDVVVEHGHVGRLPAVEQHLVAHGDRRLLLALVAEVDPQHGLVGRLPVGDAVDDVDRARSCWT